MANVAQLRSQLAAAAQGMFGKRLITLQHRRITRQDEWRQEFETTFAPPSDRRGPDEDAQRLIFYLNNDDHPYVDFNHDVLQEGLARLRADPQPFKSIFMSHWGEILGLIGKQGQTHVEGSYVHGQITLTDSYQIMNLGFLRHLLLEVKWAGPLRRLDELYRMKAIFGNHIGPAMFLTPKALHRMYVPLREQCRKFDAYKHAQIPYTVVPQLVLPPESNTAETTLPRSMAHIARVITFPGNTYWSRMKPLRGGTWLPTDEVVQRVLQLYSSTGTGPR